MRESSYQQEARSDRIVVRNRGEATVKILETFKAAQKENYSTLDFHNEKHPEAVRRTALEFAKIIMREDPKLVTKGTLMGIVNSAASHDSVLNFAHGEMITRFRGFFETDIKDSYRAAMRDAGVQKGNELLSAERLDQEMDKYVDEKGDPIFDEASRKEMRDAIAATFPEFDFTATIPDRDFEQYFGGMRVQETGLEKYRTGIKVWQPHLRAEGSITALAIATGDLRGEVAHGDYEVFRESGNGEFRELNEGLRSALLGGIETISHDKKMKVAENALKWIKSQITFAMWQKVLFWESINSNQSITDSPKSAAVKQALKDRYDPNFDRNILKAKERYEALEEEYGEGGSEKRTERLARLTDADFRELLDELGFSLNERSDRPQG